MKITLNKKPEGIVLLVALFILVAAGIVLASYLTLASSESKITSRSQVWNQCVPVMEAGVEEAMAQIQFCNGTTNFGSNIWTRNSTNYYQKSRTNTDGSYFVVTLQPALPPTIFSTAYIPVPGTTNYINRSVRVTTTNGAGGAGLKAKSTITMDGNGVFDSYNSALYPNVSGSTAYSDYVAAYGPGTNGVAETLSTATPAIALGPKGSAHLYGQAVTGPGGSVTISSGSALGNCTSSGTIPSGWTNNDSNFQITDPIPAPSTNGWFTSLPSGIKLSGVTYTYSLNSANYYVNGSLNLSGVMMLSVQGNCQLYITGGLTIANGAYITLMTNAALTVYLGGGFTNQGAGTINNSGPASALTIYGLSTSTDFEFVNGTAFTGSIDAPEAMVNVTGAGGIYGQVTANSIYIGNSGAVHFDQGLSGSQYYNAFSWNEY